MNVELPSLPGRYALHGLIGTGATGRVYRARDLVLELDVAVKVVRRNLALHRRFRARFAREVALSAQLVHPRLVPLHDLGQAEDGSPFVAMAYADAGNLGDLLGSSPPLYLLLQLIDEVLEALASLHARRLVHQDLKPHNVLLHRGPGGELHAWVSDLGEANALTVLAQDRRAVGGTPAYMAPEQLLSQTQEMGPWTDLYAVGLLLYEALCERPPHSGRDRRQLAEERQRPPPPVEREDGAPVPESLAELVETLLDPDPRRRYERAADVRRVIARALSEMETGVRVRRVRRRPPPSPSSGRRLPLHPSGEALLSATEGGGEGFRRVPPDPMPPEPPEVYGFGAPARASLPLFALRELPLVGRRDIQLATWRLARRVVESGEPQVVVVVGASGTGKTRLAESIARALDEGGYMETLRLRYHWPPGMDDGYRGAVLEILAPWQDERESLERRLQRWIALERRVPPEEARAEASVLARWTGMLSPGEPRVNAAAGLAFLYRYLDVRSWRGGACLLLDDAHRAREAGDGLDIARSVLDGSIGHRPLFVLVTVAEEAIERDSGLRQRLERLEALGAHVLHLPPLSLEDTRNLLAEALLLDPRLTDAVARICAGNPLAVSLLLRNWANRDLLLMGEDSRFQLRPGAPIEEAIPQDIETLYLLRLQAAVQASEDPAAAAEALALTALAGPEPPVPLVRELCESGLDDLLATGVLRQEGTVLVFEHEAVERTARELARRLPDAQELHRRLAEAWKRIGERTGMEVDLPVGNHYLAAGDPQAAASYLLSAVRALIETGRTEMALLAARRALDAVDRAGFTMGRQEARMLAAEAQLERRAYDEAEQYVREALTLEPLDRLTRGRLQLLLARVYMGRGDLDGARRYLDQAANSFETVRDRDGLCDVAHGRASLERLEGAPARAIGWFHRALGLLRDDPRREVLVLSGLIESMLSSGQVFGVDRYRHRMMEVAQRSGDTRSIAKAAYTSGLVYLYRRRLDLAERYFQTAAALSATLGDHWLHMNGENNLGEVARFQGDPERAREHYARYCRLAEESGLEAASAVGHLNLALLALQLGEDGELREQLGLAERALQHHPRHWTWVFVGLLRALLAAEEGDEAHCRAWWSVAREHGLAQLRTPDLWLPLQRLARAAGSAGWQGIAAAALETARSLAPVGREESLDVLDEE